MAKPQKKIWIIYNRFPPTLECKYVREIEQILLLCQNIQYFSHIVSTTGTISLSSKMKAIKNMLPQGNHTDTREKRPDMPNFISIY